MGRYGLKRYGTFVYGEPDANRLYYSSGITAYSYDYNKISVTWSSIIADPLDLPYVPTHWKLVRTFTGVSDSPYTGDVLDSGVITSFRLSYTDIDLQITSDAEITYTIWVSMGEVIADVYTGNRRDWINCGSATANVTLQTTLQDSFKAWLPAAWLNESNGVGDAVGEPEETSLSKTVDAYGFAYDKIKTQATLLGNSAEAYEIPSVLLKNKVTDLGFLYEPSLGDTYHRSLYKSGNFINSYKGTLIGLNSYSVALTHWTSTTNIGQNLLLDFNDSSFEQSTGRWTPEPLSSGTTWTLTRQAYATSLADIGTAVTPPTTTLYDRIYPPRAVGFAKLTCGSANDQQELRLPATSASKVLYGVPVTAGKKYLFTGFVRSRVAPTGTQSNNTIAAYVKWYDKDGTFITGGTGYGPSIRYTTSWQEFSSYSDSGRNGDLAPTGAVYAAIEFLINKSGAQIVDLLFDMLQFAEATNTFLYEDSRLVKLLVNADIENLIPNPSFDSGSSGWEPYNADLTQDFNPPSTAKVHGVAVGKLTPIINGSSMMVSDWLPTLPGTQYTFSIYASGSAARQAKVRIEFSSPQSEENQTKILTDVDGAYYETNPYYVDSTALTLSTTATRLSISAVSPVYTPDYGNSLVKVSVYFPNAVVGDEFYLDAAMLTNSTQTEITTNYFQGSGAPVPVNPLNALYFNPADISWERRDQLNLISNSSFSDTTGWTAAVGTTFTVSTSNPLYGTHRANVSASGGGSISTVVTLPWGAATGGEDIIVSAYVRNTAGTYSISTNGQAVGNFKVSEANKNEWTRISVPRVAVVGETTFTITISLTDAGSGTKVFYVDGAQAEFGRIATPFVNPANAETSTIPNPADITQSIYCANSYMVNSGTSYYATRYLEKLSRLNATLPTVIPIAASWSINHPSSLTSFEDTTDSLIPAPSFENSLKGWVPTAATLTRSISRGTMFDEFLTHGAAFCKVAATAASAFSIGTGFIPVTSLTGYYAAVAVKPENEDAYGNFSLAVKWYDSSYNLLRTKTKSLTINRHDRWAYLDVITPGSKRVSITSGSITSNVATVTTLGEHGFSVGEPITVSTTGSSTSFPGCLTGSYTISAVTTNTVTFAKTFGNIAETSLVGLILFVNSSVSYAKVSVTSTPTSLGVGRTFHVDKVLFRE